MSAILDYISIFSALTAFGAVILTYFVIKPAIQLKDLRYRIIQAHKKLMAVPVPITPAQAAEVYAKRPDLLPRIQAAKAELKTLADELSAFNKAEPIVWLLRRLGVTHFENARSGLSGLSGWFDDAPRRSFYEDRLKKALFF